MADLSELVRRVREHPGLLAKRDLAHVAETVGGDGDDAALVRNADGNWRVLAAEAIRPELVGSDPRVAGVAGVVTVLNDVAATGGRGDALLNTVVGPEPVVRGALEGIAMAAELYGVPVVGGHTTVRDGEAGLSTFAMGTATQPLRAARARVGDAVFLVTCVEGEMIAGPDGALFFSHLRGPRRDRVRSDLALLAEAADAGEAWAARDVSMPGLVGSLLQFVESAGRLGCTLDLAALPCPQGVGLGDWLVAFPSFGFLLCGSPDTLPVRFGGAGLTCARVGELDATGVVSIAAADERVEVWDLYAEPLAALRAVER